MADPQHVEVELSALLQDQDSVALKGLVSAPIGYRADHLARLARAHSPIFGTVTPAEVVAALVHDARPDAEDLSRIIASYRNAKVWETRRSLGEETPEQGLWKVPVRARGQRSS